MSSGSVCSTNTKQILKPCRNAKTKPTSLSAKSTLTANDLQTLLMSQKLDHVSFFLHVHTYQIKTVHRSPTWQVICSSAVETNNGNSCLDSWLQHHHLTTLETLQSHHHCEDTWRLANRLGNAQTLLPTTVIWPAMHIVSLDLHPFFIVYNDSGLVFFLENLQHLRNYNHWSGDHMRHMTELAGHCVQDSHFVASSHLTKPSIDFADISEPWFHFVHSKVHTWDTWLVATWLTWLGLNLTTWSLSWTCCFRIIIMWG